MEPRRKRSDLPRRSGRLGKSTPRYAQVLHALRERIERGELKPGARVATVPELARQYQCGHSSVREALRILGHQQLLRIEHGRGIFVSDAPKLPEQLLEHVALSGPAMLDTLLEARRLIEPGLAALAAVRGTERDIHIIAKAAERMSHCVADGGDVSEPDQLLHQQIADAAGNPVLRKMMAVVLDLLFESRPIMIELAHVQPNGAQYHKLIAAAISDRDAGRAESLMRAHLDDAKAAIDRARAREGISA